MDIARDLTSDQLRDSPADANLYKVTSPTTNQMYMAGNEGYAPFAKSEVRQALKWAIDYDGIQKNIVAGHLHRESGVRAQHDPGRGDDQSVQPRSRQGEGAAGESRLSAGIQRDARPLLRTPLCRYRDGDQADLAAVGIKVSLLPGTRKQM